MNEEIEYAEMLEIPVSTVNVVHKKPAKKHKTIDVLPQDERALKESVIAQVNQTASEPETQSPDTPTEPEKEILLNSALLAESVNSNGSIQFDDVPERIDTVRLYSDAEREQLREEQLYGENIDQPQTEQPLFYTQKQKRLRWILGAEFAACCALCGGIFLTNVFMPNSAINTFFRTLDKGAPTAQLDTRTYADFTLSSVVSDFSNAEVTVSPTGIVSFTDECCVYPAADGKVQEVIQNADGSYTLKIAYSDLFTGVFGGLDQVYYAQGDEVKTNVPIGYTDGETEVQVTLYASGAMLNCFEVTDENCLAWISQE